MFRLGIAQIQPGNVEKVAGLVKEADLVLLPEYSLFDPTGLPAEEVWQRATTLEDFVERLGRIASRSGAYVAGAFLERGPRPRVYNTTALVSPSGALVGIYRKTHLFDAYGYRESDVVEPGAELSQVFDVKGVKVGFAVCFELRFPEVFRELALAGVQLAAVPAAWYSGPSRRRRYTSWPGHAQWRTACTSRWPRFTARGSPGGRWWRTPSALSRLSSALANATGRCP